MTKKRWKGEIKTETEKEKEKEREREKEKQKENEKEEKNIMVKAKMEEGVTKELVEDEWEVMRQDNRGDKIMW